MHGKDRFIQIVRITACCGVLLVHCSSTFGATGILGNILSFGQYGLYVFFVLSGFLAAKWNGVGRRKWIKKKVVKLFPLYLVMLFLYMIIHTILLNDCPKDIYKLGWIRYLLGLNAILPANNIFWKSIHAIWYVSVVWIFYLIHSVCWNHTKDLKPSYYIFLFNVFSICALYINRYDELATVNFFAFVQYFVLGIIAEKVSKVGNTKSLWAIFISPLIVYVSGDMWLFKNLLAGIIVTLIVIIGKNRWFNYRNKKIEKIVDAIERGTYAIYLVHPCFLDYVVNIFKMLGISTQGVIGLFLIFMFGTVIIICEYEKYIQKIIMHSKLFS